MQFWHIIKNMKCKQKILLPEIPNTKKHNCQEPLEFTNASDTDEEVK